MNDSELAPLLKDFIGSFYRDRQETKEALRDGQLTLSQTRDCLTNIKVQLERIKTLQDSFAENCKERVNGCLLKHKDFETRLRSTPSSDSLKNVDALSKKVDKLTMIIYTAIGGLVIISAIAKWIFPIIIKKYI